MEYLPTKYKEIGSFDFINLTEEKGDVDLLAYAVKFRPRDAYGNEDKVAWSSEVLTIPKYEGHEDDWKKWCLYHSMCMRKTYLAMTAVGGKAFIASTDTGPDEAKKTFTGYMPSIIPVMEALLGNDKSFFDKETKRSRFQNVKYLNVAKREPIDTKHLKYRAGLLDAIKEEYSFAVANHIEAYLAIRDLHAKADLSNKVIITNTEAHSVEVDRNTVVEVRATIQVKDRETNEKVLILKFVAPYAEIQESPLGASTNSYCKVYSNRQKYYVQLEEVLNELYNELKAGIA
jgi:hypothetical protein